MKLAYFPKYCALNSQPPMAAFLSSCQRHGIELIPDSLTADAAVIWSVTWAGRLLGNQEIFQQYRKTGRPVIILEIGSLHRGHTWKIAVNNITADGYYGHTDNLDLDRPAKLKLPLSTDTQIKDSILIVAQNNRSLQVNQIPSVDQWILDTISCVKKQTQRPIIIRPHPRSKLNIGTLPDNVSLETPAKLVGTYDSFDINYHHYRVINYNSGAGIQAALTGANIIVDKSSLAHPVSGTIEQIDNTTLVDRDQWTIEIAHTEYLTKEIEKGLWIQRLSPMLPL